jgi:formylglycine-generating enzyme required for sulfatase activity
MSLLRGAPRRVLIVTLAAVSWVVPAVGQTAPHTQTTASPPQGQAVWDPPLFNPKPASDDLILPLPCGGGIAFRVIAVPSGAGALDDRAIQLGNPDAELGFNEYQRGAFLAGPFRDANGTRLFYMGKYDVTSDQYAAVMDNTCPQPSPRGRAAKASVSWFDAVGFTTRLSTWLLTNAADKLPKQDHSLAFVRLPTEEEWEYAARGGAAVSESDYLAPTWPMPEGPERYAVAGAGVSDGKAQQVGQLLPNPLGLYDVLGNVEQWVLEPYRLNRVGRLQGAAGGQVTRGGSFATPLEELRTSMRSEVPPYDPVKKAPTRLESVGFRVMLSAVVGGELKDVAVLRQAFETLQHSNAEGTDLHGKIERLKQLTPDETLRRALEGLSAQLAGDERARADAGRETVRAELSAATALCYVVWRVQRIVDAQKLQLDKPEFKDLQTSGMVLRVRAAIAINQTEQQTALDAYVQLLRQVVADAPLPVIAEESQVVTQEMAVRVDRRRRFVEVVVRHITELGGGHAVAPDVMLHDITAIQAAAP